VTAQKAGTLEPNVGAPGGKKHREGEEPDQQWSGLGQMLGWIQEMRREQAETNRQLLEGFQDLAARQTCALEQLWLAPAPRNPSPLRRNPDPGDPSPRPNPDPRDRSPLRQNPDPCDPSPLLTPEPGDPCCPQPGGAAADPCSPGPVGAKADPCTP